jgi:uncharacterized protein (DUF2237 family)
MVDRGVPTLSTRAGPNSLWTFDERGSQPLVRGRCEVGYVRGGPHHFAGYAVQRGDLDAAPQCRARMRRTRRRRMATTDRNVLGGPLAVCSAAPRTGYFRDGCCNTGPDDAGIHVIYARMTREFLDFERSRGNDLVTPIPEAQFPGLKPGDRWCVCAGRWREAFDAGVAPPVVLEATHEEALAIVRLADLRRHALDLN